MDRQQLMAFGAIERVAIFGGSWIVAALLDDLAARPWRTCVFTSPRHLEDVVNDAGDTFRAVLDRSGIPYHCSDAINDDPVALDFAGSHTLGIAFGAAWTFTPEFAQQFAGRLLDFMGIRLPEYRGGAHYTWQILNDDRRGACNLQVVLGGEDSFHLGPLIKSYSYNQPAAARTPADYFASAVAQEKRFVLEFLRDVVDGREFALSELDEASASFFPFLHSKIQAWIDWSASTSEVERFVCAFDEPYAGASTWWRKKRVFLKGASQQAGGPFHPFAAGLVFRNDARGVWICLRDGALLVRSVRDEEGADITAQIEKGSRFLTPRDTLDQALATEIVYGAAGPMAQVMLP